VTKSKNEGRYRDNGKLREEKYAIGRVVENGALMAGDDQV
jgi:hypothetical protein